MRAAIHLHLHYPDIALELIERVVALGRADIDTWVTYSDALDPAVDRALERLAGRVERVAVANVGWDIGPLFTLLPRLAIEDYGAICHLHTKKGDSGYAAEWRALALGGTIADAPLVTRILAAFEARPDVALIGSGALYKSAASHQFRNGEILSGLAPALVAPLYPPADWGFFAGTMFWARPAVLARVAALIDFAGRDAQRDGTTAHAAERLFGLAAIAEGGAIGLVEDGAVEIVTAPGEPSDEPIVRTLVVEAERAVAPLDAELPALIAAHNPLLDYIAHGRDDDALDPNPYFSSQWYNRIHPDIFAAGMHPLQHYMLHGWEEGRSTGPLFDGAFYRREHPEVSGDPLRHFLETAAEDRQAAIPISRPDHGDPAARPRRFYRRFDIAAEAAFLKRIAALPGDEAATRVSIIMPAYNRAGTIGAAIRSVLAQTHGDFELIVVDDGSSDDTREIVRGFLGDRRVRLVAGAHGGVSAARNLGLAEANGEYVAYLDSDNRWNGWFLEVMLRFLIKEELEAGYSAIALRDDLGQLTGYRGDDFDWEACLQQNYVDLNAFVHRRDLIGEVGGFDPALRRMVDWDLILRIGRDRRVGYAPFVGCDYFDGKADPHRITTAEPVAYQKLVATKNRTGLAVRSAEFARTLQLSFAIKIAAPEDEKEAWGDWHFAQSLAEAIARLGHVAHVDFRDRWSGRSLADEDVAIVLRGLIPYEPRAGQIALMWNISHPDQVAYEEYDAFTRVYVASGSTAALLRHIVSAPVATLQQATDAARFRPHDAPPEGPDILFVGNSRGVERDIVRWAIEAGRAPTLYGGGWDGLVPDGLVKARTIDNRVLGAAYAGAGAVLNDHWPSMAAFGFLSNRLFDIVAAGGRAVSDPVASMAATFGGAVAQVDGPAALAKAVDRLVAEPRPHPARSLTAERIRSEHSFDARAATMVSDVLGMLGMEAPFAPPAAPAILRRAPLKVRLIAPHAPHGPQSSAYIRMIAPLTNDRLDGRIALDVAPADIALGDADICIVQRTALVTRAAAEALADTARRRNCRIVVDIDDGFALMDADHPEAADYAPLNAALGAILGAADEGWFSTAALSDAYPMRAAAIIPNAIDPRIWRDWRNPRPLPFQHAQVRMLYMGTHTHGTDFALIRPALERLALARPGQFDVTLIGVAPDIAPAPWLRRLSPPAEAVSYPRFVRWLRGQGPFDLGLAPLADTPFNRAKSDIKLLDYAALGLLPVVSEGPAYRADPAAAEIAVHAYDWQAVLARVLDDREGWRAIAGRAHAHVWAHRGSGEIARLMADRLEALR